jgi:hypothetical protein
MSSSRPSTLEMTPELPHIESEVMRHWHQALRALREVPIPNIPNAPKHPFVFLMWTCDDGLERTKGGGYKVPEAMLPHLEALFPGDLDDQKWAFIDLLRRTALALMDSPVNELGKKGAPSAMEWLEAEAIARLPSTPDDREEAQHCEWLRDMRREYLFGRPPASVWTGAMQPVEKTSPQGNYHRKRGDERGRLLRVACDAVLNHWLDNLEKRIAAQERPCELGDFTRMDSRPASERRFGRRRRRRGASSE